MSLRRALPRSDTTPFWKAAPRVDHSVQIYGNDVEFLDALEDFVLAGLQAGDGVVVIATANHRRALERRLARRTDLEAALREDCYMPVDAEERLASFTVDGRLDEARFKASTGELIARAGRNGRPVRVFGEVVVLLCARGQLEAALRLEQLWNQLCAREKSFCLFCAYPRRIFASADAEQSIRAVCSLHTRELAAAPALERLQAL